MDRDNARSVHMQELIGEVIHLNEVLTMSARMAAATLDPAWEARYRGFEPKLDVAIDLISRVDPETMSEFVAQTGATNHRSVEMENRAFALVRRNDSAAASAILTSPEYDRQKEVYADGMRQMSASIKKRGEAGLESAQNQMLWVVGGVLGALVPVTLYGLAVFRTSKRRATERFRVLFESSGDALMTVGPPAWKFTSGNSATVALFNAKDVAEFISCGPCDLSPERQPDGRATADKAKEMIETAMREGSHYFEWTHKRLGGEEFPATVLLTRMEYGGKTILQATVRDITERKRTEEALREADEFNQQIVNCAREGIIVYGRDLRFKTWNPYMEQLSGLSAKAVLGRHAVEVFPFLQNAGVSQRLEGILTGETPEAMEFAYQVPQTGRAGWASDVSAPLRNAAGEIVGIIGTVRDVTEKKQAEEELVNEREFLNTIGEFTSEAQQGGQKAGHRG
ncbi:MAG: PAS domain S-box protein [Planctomycetota bacterium]|nr:PAS domain S-box protein [Planctomycetota bacterium]